MGLLVRFEDRAVPFVLAALKNVQRQVPVGGQDGIMVAGAVKAVEDGWSEAEGWSVAPPAHFSPPTAAEFAHVSPADPTGLAGMPARSEAGAPTPAAPGTAFAQATASPEPAPLTPDQAYEADVAEAGEEYNRLLLAAQARLNAAHTAAL